MIMKTLRLHFSHILLLALVFAMSACHSSRNAATLAAGAEWHDAYMPVKVKLNSPMSMSLSGRATIVRDSLVNVSMRVLGMEVAVVNMTPDSVVFVDKYHKYLFAERLQTLLGSHQLTLGDIQDIILGLKPNAPLNQLSFNNPGNEKPVTVTFSDFVDTPAGSIAQNVALSAPLNKSEVDAELIWSASSATWNSGRTVDFVTPSKGYKRVSIQNALNSFKNM
jgi:hypothetical protein